MVLSVKHQYRPAHQLRHLLYLSNKKRTSVGTAKQIFVSSTTTRVSIVRTAETEETVHKIIAGAVAGQSQMTPPKICVMLVLVLQNRSKVHTEAFSKGFE